MALLNRPMTEQEACEMLDSWKRTGPGAFRSLLWELLSEPAPHVVHYRNTNITYVSPDRFLIHRIPDICPSSSVWIVPGTLERKL